MVSCRVVSYRVKATTAAAAVAQASGASILSKLPGVQLLGCSRNFIETVRGAGVCCGACRRVGDVAAVTPVQIGDVVRPTDLPRKLVLLCSKRGSERSPRAVHFLRGAGFETVAFPVPDGSPTLVNIARAVDFVKRVGCGGVVGFGGGGIMDMSKVGGPLPALRRSGFPPSQQPLS
jgi:hypothetical protein